MIFEFLIFIIFMNAKFNANYFEPFKYKSLKDLKKKIEELNLNLPISPEVEILQTKAEFSNIIIPNRLSIQPMEGFDAKKNGSPSNLTHRRYMRYAKGGVGLIWFEAVAISDDCKSNNNQLVLKEENKKSFRELINKVRIECNKNLKSLGFKNSCVLILQTNHSGRYTIRDGKRFPIRVYENEDLDRAKGINKNSGKILNDEELREIEDLWVEKALLAKEVGFDGVDIKACHGYLIAELLESRLRNDSEYGGESLENRSKLLINIIRKLRNLIKNDSDFIITSRLGVYNGVPYPRGFGVKKDKNSCFPAPIDLSEPLNIIIKLYNLNVRLLNISAGNPHYKPFITRPFDTPVKGKPKPSEHPLISVNRLLNLASSIKKQIPKDMIIIGSGFSYLRQYAGYIAAGMVEQNKIDICGFGRMAFANPEFAKQIFQNGKIDARKTCITCSKCSELMLLGKNTGCAIRDPQYKNII